MVFWFYVLLVVFVFILSSLIEKVDTDVGSAVFWILFLIVVFDSFWLKLLKKTILDPLCNLAGVST